MENVFAVKCNGEYYAKSQPAHSHRDGRSTPDITKAQMFTMEPDLDDWNFDEDAEVQVITIEVLYKIVKVTTVNNM